MQRRLPCPWPMVNHNVLCVVFLPHVWLSYQYSSICINATSVALLPRTNVLPYGYIRIPQRIPTVTFVS